MTTKPATTPPPLNRSGIWVLLWMLIGGLVSVVAGLVVWIVVHSSGVSAASSSVAALGACASAFGLFLAVPATVKALKELYA